MKKTTAFATATAALTELPAMAADGPISAGMLHSLSGTP